LLLLIGLSGDDVHREPPIGQMIERRDFARHQRRRNETRPMGNEIAELFGVSSRVQRDQEPFGGRRGVANQREVKACLIMGARKLREGVGGEAAFNDVERGVAARRGHADHSNDPGRHN
jgi:hypothetical protein